MFTVFDLISLNNELKNGRYLKGIQREPTPTVESYEFSSFFGNLLEGKLSYLSILTGLRAGCYGDLSI